MTDESVADKPAALQRMLDDMRDHNPTLVAVIELAWAHPDEWADGEFDAVIDRELGGEIDDAVVGATRAVLAAGAMFEQAYPAGQRGRWPVPLSERVPDDNGGGLE